MMGCLIFGFVLGDPLIDIFGLNMVHWSITILFTISAIFLLFINYKEPAKEDKKTLKDFIDELKQGFQYIKNTPIVSKAMLKLAALFSIIVMLSILSISISHQLLYPDNPSLGARKFAYIIACCGLGMVTGSFIVGEKCRNINKSLLISSGFTLIGSTLILLTLVGLIPNHLYITIKKISLILSYRVIYSHLLTGIIGFGMAFVAIPLQTILQSTIPEEMRGKVFGVQFNLLSAASTVPVVIVAFGADWFGVSTIIMIIGLPVMMFGIYGLLKLKKEGQKSALSQV
jgi:hypothetical protein